MANMERGINEQAAEAMVELLRIMSYYHKDYTNTGHADVCENPYNCGHCRATKEARLALRAMGYDTKIQMGYGEVLS